MDKEVESLGDQGSLAQCKRRDGSYLAMSCV
jgi:hypothetical protein